MDTPLRTNAHSATCRTHALTLQENAPATPDFGSEGTTQLANLYTRLSAKHRKGGGLHSAPDLTLIAADTGNLPQTTTANLATLSPQVRSSNLQGPDHTSSTDWFDPIPSLVPRNRRHTDVSEDPRYNLGCFSAAELDAECATASRRIP